MQSRRSKLSSHEKRFFAIGLAVLATLSPLYIDRRSIPEDELEDEPIDLSSYLPLLLLVLITAIAVSGYLEHGFSRFDPYWIHRVGGSSTGIVILLVVLAFVLKFKV